MNFQPNELFKRMAVFYAENKNTTDPKTGRRLLPKIANQGSSRSGKTYATIQLIYVMCNAAKEAGRPPLYIAVLRDTLVDCRKFTYKDFTECFEMMGVTGNCDITEHPNPKIKLYGSTIEFMGIADQRKSGQSEAPRTDITFVNEIITNNQRSSINGWVRRCNKLFICDWNPSYTDHWVFDLQKGKNTLYTQTCYLDNDSLSDENITSIESTCPWDFADSHIEEVNGFKKRIWDKPERPDNCPLDQYHLYRADNEDNIAEKTVNKWEWLVYGEGEAAPREGAVFDPSWINEFPETGMDSVNLSLDFGYTQDPSVLVRSGVELSSKTLYAESMTYSPTPDVDSLFELIYPKIMLEIARRKREALWAVDKDGNEVPGLEIANIVVACDSADKYKDLQFVRDLNVISMQRGLGWQFVKVKKPSITVRISLMKRFKMCLVRDAATTVPEAQNYVYRKIEGKTTNIPEDSFNHFWDSLGYGVWYFYRWLIGM